MISSFVTLTLLIASLPSVFPDTESCTYYGPYETTPSSSVACSDCHPGTYQLNGGSATNLGNIASLKNGGKLYVTAWGGTPWGSPNCLKCLKVASGSKYTLVTVVDNKGAGGVDLSAPAFDCLFGSNAHVGGGNYPVQVTVQSSGPCSGGGGCFSGSGPSPPAPSPPAPSPPTPKPPTPPTSGCTKTYKVVSGDTGLGIASKNGISWTTLQNLNKNVNWNNLQIGQPLCVGGTAAAEVTSGGSYFQSNMNWIIPVIIVFVIILIAIVVVLRSKSRSRSDSGVKQQEAELEAVPAEKTQYDDTRAQLEQTLQTVQVENPSTGVSTTSYSTDS